MNSDIVETETWVADLTADVPLDPELQGYVEELDHFTALRHPLVMSVPYLDVGVLNKSLNEMLEHKRERLADAEEKRDFDRYLLLHERPYRLLAFIQFHYRYRPDPASYWPALAWHWIDAEDPDGNSEIYEDYFTRPYPDRYLLMTEDERRAFDRLPERVTVYRGAPHEYRRGLSWTTDPGVSYFFATRWDATDPVYRMEVAKRDCLAYFTRRQEAELIVHPRAWLEPVLHCETKGMTRQQRRCFRPKETETQINGGAVSFYVGLDKSLEPDDRSAKLDIHVSTGAPV